MRKIVAIIVCIFSIFTAYSLDSLNINQTILTTAYPNKFTGVSSISMYEHISSNYDSTTHAYNTHIYDTIYSLIKPLNLKVFRFPGGTIGNYYHFYGKGYGIDTSETVCAPSRVGTFNFANMFLSFDNKVDKNIISYLSEEIDTLKKYTDGIGICFKVNSHTHFYKGDLKKYTDTVQQLINKYFIADTAFLRTNGNNLDSNKINYFVGKLLQLQNDAAYKRIKNNLMHDTGFIRRFNENMDAVAYLRSKNIPILGAEIGNETYAEYVVFDDNLSYLGFDCTQAPDSFHFDLMDLPMRYVLQGMLKNNLLVSLYSDSLKAKFNIVSAVPANIGFNYLTLNVQYHPEHIKRYDITVKKSDLWNKYYASQQNVFAIIPHLYSQEFLTCANYMNSDSLYGISKKRIDKIAEEFYKYYIDTLITYNLQRLHFYGNNKPLWITEWNFSGESYANNTFLHAYYNYYFIKKMLEIHEYDPNYIQILIYHHLSGASNIWPLIRTTSPFYPFKAEKQIIYAPFYIWSNTMNKQVKKVKTSLWKNINSTLVDAFIDETKREFIIQFVNTDSVNHYIPLSDVQIKDNTTLLDIDSISYYVLDAASFTSTNYTSCSFFNNPAFDNSYQTMEGKLAQKDTLWMPAISMGKFTIQLKEKITTDINNNKTNTLFQIYPNPATHTLHIYTNHSSTYTFTVFDANGKSIFSGKLIGQDNSIYIGNLAKGLYHIQLTNETQSTYNHSFIKM
ncbi:MAG: T9SS type A sorting domain-containing protein [Chitinophagales bacterium]